jgi:hypothetical protein
MQTRTKRFFVGLAVVLVILTLAFALLPGWIHTWGATDQEATRAMPGDELLSDPALTWTHGIAIQAPPEQVWPWIAQIGVERSLLRQARSSSCG